MRIKRIKGQHTSVDQIITNVQECFALKFGSQQVHKTASCYDGAGVFFVATEVCHISGENIEIKSFALCFFLCQTTHGFREIGTIGKYTIFGKIQQNRSGPAGDIDHAAFSVFSCEIKVEILKSRMIILILIHRIKIQIVIFRHISKIVQIHFLSFLVCFTIICNPL